MADASHQGGEAELHGNANIHPECAARKKAFGERGKSQGSAVMHIRAVDFRDCDFPFDFDFYS